MRFAFVLPFLFLFQTSTPTTPQSRLSYEVPVSLNGIIKRHTFPGPPNYESVKKGDEPEQVWVLHLSSPICVSASSDGDAQSDISDLQLVLVEGQKQYARYRSLLGTRVEVTGKLFQAETGHHHTKVLLTVNGIKRQPTQPGCGLLASRSLLR